MSQIYQVEVQLCATAYVKAKSAGAAREKAERFARGCFEFSGQEISGLRLADPRLPDVSLSPAMTGNGVWPNATAALCE